MAMMWRRAAPVVAGLVLVGMAAGGLPAPAAAAEGYALDIESVDLSPAYPWSQNDYDKSYPPEGGLEGILVEWRLGVELEDGVIDLATEVENPEKCAVYARVLLESDRACRLTLSMGSDDGIAVFVNGECAFRKNAMRGLKPNEDRTEVALRKGPNELLFRVTQGGGGYAMQVAARVLGDATVNQVFAKGPPPAATFEYRLDERSLTSAGVYDSAGKLVRVLWTKKRRPAGANVAGWDGLDWRGKPAEPGDYECRVVVNGSVYRNVGAIGNSGLPPDSKNHTPTAMHDVAVDSEGAVYTANYWDEAGHDFTKWDPLGKVVYDARYQMRNGRPNGAPYAIATDETHIYCAMEGWPGDQWKAAQQLQRFRISDGAHEKFTGVDREDGHIQLYEFPDKLVPEGTPERDAKLMHWPLKSIAVRGDELLCADALGGRVVRFDKVTGEKRGEFKVRLPVALAVDARGAVWVGYEHSRIGEFTVNGRLVRTVLSRPSDVEEVEAIAFGPRGELYVADTGDDRVEVYEIGPAAGRAKLLRTLGSKARPGDRAEDRFFDLRGVAVDSVGNVVTIQNEPVGGARVARWSPSGELLWEHFGTVFVSLGNYGAHDPDTLYSMHFHRYRLKDHARGEWEYVGNVYSGEGRGYHRDVHGVPRILRLGALGDREFVFYPTGDGVQVYRCVGEELRLAALVGGGCPTPEGEWERDGAKIGKWSWTSPTRGGVPKPEEIRWHRRPGEEGARYAVFGSDVDREGNIWFGELHSKAIWTIPLGGASDAGNPIYDWADAREFVPRETGELRFQPNMVQRAEDGSVYAFGWSARWPSPKNNPFWMGGTTLVRLSPEGERLWAVRLPAVCVGLDVVPGGGCMAGSGSAATIYHFTEDGLMIGSMKPGEAMCNQSGWMDNHASVAVNRDPRDGVLDVFAEDDYVLRIGWYRVDDRDIRLIRGPIRLTATGPR